MHHFFQLPLLQGFKNDGFVLNADERVVLGQLVLDLPHKTAFLAPARRVVGAGVKNMNLGCALQQPVEMVGHYGFLMLVGRQPHGLRRVEGDQRVLSLCLWYNTFIYRQYNDPFEVQRAGFEHPHDLQVADRLPAEWNARLTDQFEHERFERPQRDQLRPFFDRLFELFE
ncbi:hypothetical protein D3C87_1559810 [compost metagenome]